MAAVSTPALVVDHSIVDRNIARVASIAGAAGIGVRPHVKTHKSSHFAGRQLAAGAIGLTCATLSEAAGLVRAGVRTSLFVAVPFHPDPVRLALIEEVAAGSEDLLVAVENRTAIELLEGANAPVRLMLELDSGLGRTGVTPREVGDLLDTTLEIAGAFTHGGHGYSPGAGAPAAADEVAVLAAVADRLPDGAVLSVGSTPTFRHGLRPPVTETRPGTYVLGDRQQVELGAIGPSDVATWVEATVIASRDGRYVVDAGAKAIGSDRQPWLVGFGSVLHRPEDIIDRVNDNHGMIVSPDPPPVGERVRIVPNHICPVVNLHDEYVTTDGGSIPIDLRGHLV